MIDSDEVAHLIKQLVLQAVGDQRSVVYAHVASYDPVLHRVRAVVPSLRDEDGNPTVTGWLPFGAGQVGQGGGIQYHPYTGATEASPTTGEQIMLMLVDRKQGVVAAPCMFFTQANKTPAALLPTDQPIRPGEIVVAHASGSYIRLGADGGVTAQSTGPTNILSNGTCNVSAQGNCTVTSQQTVAVSAADAIGFTAPRVTGGGALASFLQLLNTAALALFNGHTHTDSRGYQTSVPNQQMAAGTHTTTNFEAS